MTVAKPSLVPEPTFHDHEADPLTSIVFVTGLSALLSQIPADLDRPPVTGKDISRKHDAFGEDCTVIVYVDPRANWFAEVNVFISSVDESFVGVGVAVGVVVGVGDGAGVNVGVVVGVDDFTGVGVDVGVAFDVVVVDGVGDDEGVISVCGIKSVSLGDGAGVEVGSAFLGSTPLCR